MDVNLKIILIICFFGIMICTGIYIYMFRCFRQVKEDLKQGDKEKNNENN
jgi:hypothetical protein